MLFAALLAMATTSPAVLFDLTDEKYSAETKRRVVAYISCLATGTFERRENSGSPASHVQQAKAACQSEYESVVQSMVSDQTGIIDVGSAELAARTLLDQFDARVIVGPPPPAALSQLPVWQLVGDWRLGRGPLSRTMRVDYTHDNAVMGKLEPGSFDWGHGLESWKVTSDGTSKAVLLATFRDGRSVAYDRIPSAPGQMNFINIGDPKIQRIDLSCVEGVLEIGLVSSESSMQLRFRLDEKPEG